MTHTSPRHALVPPCRYRPPCCVSGKFPKAYQVTKSYHFPKTKGWREAHTQQKTSSSDGDSSKMVPNRCIRPNLSVLMMSLVLPVLLIEFLPREGPCDSIEQSILHKLSFQKCDRAVTPLGDITLPIFGNTLTDPPMGRWVATNNTPPTCAEGKVERVEALLGGRARPQTRLPKVVHYVHFHSCACAVSKPCLLY